MFIFLWRLLVLVALHIGVLVLFPYYPSTAPITVFIVFVMSSGVFLGLSMLFSLLWASRSFTGMLIFDLVMIGVVSFALLILTPQINNSTPLEQLRAREIPSAGDISLGWQKIIAMAQGDALAKEIAPLAQDFRKGVSEIKANVKRTQEENQKNIRERKIKTSN